MSTKTATRTKRAGRSRRQAERPTPQQRAEARSSPMPNLPRWKWRTFPVFAAFVAGLLLDSLLNPPASDIGVAVRVAGLIGAGYVLAHVFVTNVIVARRIRAREKVLSAPEEDDEWVDEVVHPDEAPSADTGHKPAP